MILWGNVRGSTLSKLWKFNLTSFGQKIRESNIFTKEVTKEFPRKLAVSFSFFHAERNLPCHFFTKVVTQVKFTKYF